jgi:aryl-alcohol dehydrogenase-like predicted oxidoreductase
VPSSLEYRPLGPTGVRVSALGYGASPLGGVYGPIDEGEGRAHRPDGFSVARPQFATTVVGCASVATVVRNVRWATEPVDEDIVSEIEALVAPVLNTSWPTGRPANNQPEPA